MTNENENTPPSEKSSTCNNSKQTDLTGPSATCTSHTNLLTRTDDTTASDSLNMYTSSTARTPRNENSTEISQISNNKNNNTNINNNTNNNENKYNNNNTNSDNNNGAISRGGNKSQDVHE